MNNVLDIFYASASLAWMCQQEILGRLTNIFREIFENDSIALTEKSTSADFSIWDSVHHIMIIVAIETEFNVRFQIAETEDVKSLEKLVGLIERKTQERPPRAQLSQVSQEIEISNICFRNLSAKFH